MLARPSLWRVLSTRARVAAAYSVREYKQHRAGARLGLLFSILELATAMLVIASIFTLIGRQAAIGESIMLFMVTGFAPYLTFMRISSRTGASVDRGGAKNRSPLLTVTGYAFSQAVATLTLTPLVVSLICLLLYAFGVSAAIPERLGPIALSIFCLTMLGFGIGLFNAVVGRFFKPWRSIYEIMTRGLLFFSGVFYIPDRLPGGIGDVLSWNPLLHVIALFRLGFYPHYPTELLDVPYLAYWSLGVVFVGLWIERLMRRQIMV